MIEIKNVSKWYGSFQVLTDCSTSIAKGEVVVVCGPSGSGKSTLIKTVNALEPIQKGDIVVNGVSITAPDTDLPKLRSRVGMVFQHFELFPHLSVTENLTLAQIKEKLSMSCTVPAVFHALVALGLTYKKRRSMRPSRTGPTSPRPGEAGDAAKARSTRRDLSSSTSRRPRRT